MLIIKIEEILKRLEICCIDAQLMHKIRLFLI